MRRVGERAWTDRGRGGMKQRHADSTAERRLRQRIYGGGRWSAQKHWRVIFQEYGCHTASIY